MELDKLKKRPPILDREIRSAYSQSHRVSAVNNDPSMTKQSFKKESDINNIMSQYEKTGIMTNINTADPQYGFVPDFDFAEAIQLIETARESFLLVDSDIRKRFNNDPVQFTEFVTDPQNTEELRQLGLLPMPEIQVENPVETPTEPLETPAEPPPGA